MEEEKKLYPFRLCPLEDTLEWGSDEFKLADLGYRDSLVKDGWLAGNSISEVMDMYCDRVVGEDVFAEYGRQFPVQAKLIHVKGTMPLRVHPDDEIAIERYDFLGREKLWYVVRAGQGASLFLGFKEDTDATAVYEGCLDGSVEKLLNKVPVKAGDCFHIKPGTVHAASGDLLIAEISESSPLDFCLCGWGKTVSTEEFDETLGLVDALDFINYGMDATPRVEDKLTLKQFTVNRLALKNALKVTAGGADSFTIYMCVAGEAAVDETTLKAGDVILIPSEVPGYILNPKAAGTTLLEVMIEKQFTVDPYINEDAAPTLPGENQN